MFINLTPSRNERSDVVTASFNLKRVEVEGFRW